MEAYDRYVGMIFDKRYKIEQVIGIGGMAIVFKAEDILMNRKVAIKKLKEDYINDEQSVKRFINESKAVAMLSHDNIVNIYDVSVKENEKYIVMEYIDGITLKNYLKQKQRLSWQETLDITDQILKGLEHAHSKGIIHRDIKSQNILLLDGGLIKVADFGIAKISGTDGMTMTDTAIGSVHYISPEQAKGKPIDARSDLYSLGIVMYELLCGTLPFNAETPVGVAMKQVNEKMVPPRKINPNIPKGIEDIIMRTTQKDAGKRYQSAGEMRADIIALKENSALRFNQTASRPTLQKQIENENDENKKDNDENNDKKQKVIRVEGRSMMPIILGITSAFLVGFAIIGVLFYNWFFASINDTESVTITVDNYVGQIYSDSFKDYLSSKYFNVDVVYVVNYEKAANEIIDQKPVGGAQRKVIEGVRKADMTLYVCMTGTGVQLPDYTNLDYRQAQEELKDGGFKVKIEKINSDTVINSFVVKTNPAAGTTIMQGETVILYVSTGPSIEYVEVPNFVGVHQTEAKKDLAKLGISLGNVTYVEDDSERGTILRQSIPGKSTISKAYATIDFVVSAGKTVTEPVETTAEEQETTAEESTQEEETTVGEDG